MKHKSLMNKLEKIACVYRVSCLYGGQTRWEARIGNRVVSWYELRGEVEDRPRCWIDGYVRMSVDSSYFPKTIKAAIDWLTFEQKPQESV